MRKHCSVFKVLPAASLKQLFYFPRFTRFCQALFSGSFLPSCPTAFIILLKQPNFVNCFCSIFLPALGASCLAAHCPTTVINTSNYFSFLQVFFIIFSVKTKKSYLSSTFERNSVSLVKYFIFILL